MVKQLYKGVKNRMTIIILYLMRILKIEYSEIDMNKTAYRKRLLEKIRKGKL